MSGLLECSDLREFAVLSTRELSSETLCVHMRFVEPACVADLRRQELRQTIPQLVFQRQYLKKVLGVQNSRPHACSLHHQDPSLGIRLGYINPCVARAGSEVLFFCSVVLVCSGALHFGMFFSEVRKSRREWLVSSVVLRSPLDMEDLRCLVASALFSRVQPARTLSAQPVSPCRVQAE